MISNFLAEQMLYQATILNGNSSIESFINDLNSTDFSDFENKPIWVDGSGLSRYNMVTPKTFVQILHRIYRTLSWEEIESIFPIGGESGTLKNWYPGEGNPYIYAKTGTLRHNHNLSGFLKTKSGKTLIFSFMNNHFRKPTSEVKKQMQVFLEGVRDHY